MRCHSRPEWLAWRRLRRWRPTGAVWGVGASFRGLECGHLGHEFLNCGGQSRHDETGIDALIDRLAFGIYFILFAGCGLWYDFCELVRNESLPIRTVSLPFECDWFELRDLSKRAGHGLHIFLESMIG